MTSMLGKLALVITAVGALGIAALSPARVEAGVIHPNLERAAATGDPDVVRVRCDRRLSNLWSCNDEVRVGGRRDVRGRDSYAYQPCDHASQTATTARAAATAPLIGNPAEGNTTNVATRRQM